MKKQNGTDSQTPRRTTEQSVTKNASTTRPERADIDMTTTDHHVAALAHAGISRASETLHSAGGRLSRLASRVRGMLSRGRSTDRGVTTESTREADTRSSRAAQPSSSRVRRNSDIPMDRLDGAYVPTQTSLKGSFRDDGSDRHRDQEFAGGFAGDRFNDEDHLTNRSGDPRIGTHGRTYEPGESRDGSRSGR